ncbi:pilus assembly protein TadG-related protein [uncultured Sulfitobacter sp.]|uniref:pilus assembly protein TadG-related protein n=1 Tax=uncultured Sulfitobacter sp. TaxID=191468 RepID=UPI00260D895F|nr:pilus assembly protein TadG-related protein [uncultured Sulfitobacter sp.]
MTPSEHLNGYTRDERGSMLVFWAFSLVAFLGLMALIFDVGRLGTTQSELQSFADSVALASAAELDGRTDAIDRAQNAARLLITDSQTFTTRSKTLTGADVTLTFYRPNAEGRFLRTPALRTTQPRAARFVDVAVVDSHVPLGFGAIFRDADINTRASARATGTFELEACNVAPVAMCAPTIGLDADAAIGSTLQLDASVNVNNLLPGNISVVNNLTDALDGLSICAGLLGDALNACLIASRTPETACTGRGGLEISVGLDGDGVMQAVNTRFGEAVGAASGLVGDAFAAAPSIFAGRLDGAGLCQPDAGGPVALPSDDCFDGGGCTVQGNGDWETGRLAYINAHFDGTDPFPEARTRFDFYRAELAASGEISTGSGGGDGLIGGLLGTVTDTVNQLTGRLCAPLSGLGAGAALDPERRLMVIAAIDCLNVDVQAGVSAPVIQYFEAFALGPAADGKLNVEVTACLGSGCRTGDGRGALDTVVRDVVRLVE